MKVAEILKQKGQEVITVRPDETVATLCHKLRLARIGAMVVIGDRGELAGIVSERDIVHGLADHGPHAMEMKVRELMSQRVFTVTPEDTIARVARIMTETRERHVPVLEDRRLVGVISIGDVVKHRLEEMTLEASVLRDMAAAH